MEPVKTVDLTATYKCSGLYDPGKLGSFEGHFVSEIETVRAALYPIEDGASFSRKADASIQVAYLAGVLDTLKPMIQVIQQVKRDFGGSPLHKKGDWEFSSGIGAIVQGFLGVGAAVASIVGVSAELDDTDLKTIIAFDGFAASTITGISLWRWWVGSGDSRHDRVQEIMQRLDSHLVFYQSISNLHGILSTLEKHKVVVKRRKEWRRSRELALRTSPTNISTTCIRRKSPRIGISTDIDGSSGEHRCSSPETVGFV